MLIQELTGQELGKQVAAPGRQGVKAGAAVCCEDWWMAMAPLGRFFVDGCVLFRCIHGGANVTSHGGCAKKIHDKMA